jgi:methionyl aminopeptidase
MIYLKSPYQINQIEKANKIGAEFLQLCYDHLKADVITLELEELAKIFCEKHKVRPSFYRYRGFPHLLCVSVNEEIVHGFPSEYCLKNGDIISVDFGVEKDGYYSDAAFTKIIGDVPESTQKLVKTTEECLYKGIEMALPDNRLYDISHAIFSHANKNEFDVIRDYVGHGVGLEVHEDPKVPNYVSFGVNWKLRAGMVIAIEPMLVEGTYKVKVKPNNWTVITADEKLSAHFEHSIAILEDGPKILSKL